MTRNATLFREVGTALFGSGPHWHSMMSEALEVHSRTIRRWASGEFVVPHGVWEDLAALCFERGKTLTSIAAKLKSPPQVLAS